MSARPSQIGYGCRRAFGWRDDWQQLSFPLMIALCPAWAAYVQEIAAARHRLLQYLSKAASLHVRSKLPKLPNSLVCCSAHGAALYLSARAAHTALWFLQEEQAKQSLR